MLSFKIVVCHTYDYSQIEIGTNAGVSFAITSMINNEDLSGAERSFVQQLKTTTISVSLQMVFSSFSHSILCVYLVTNNTATDLQ